MKRTSNVEKLLGLAILVFCVGAAVFALSTQSGAPPQAASSASVAPNGRAALYALARELDLPVREWRRPPGQLPRKPALLWLPRVPTDQMPEPTAVEIPGITRRSPPLRSGVHEASAYFDFVEAGGTLLLAGGEATSRFLVDDLGLEEPPASRAPVEGGDTGLTVTTSTGEKLLVSETTPFTSPDPDGPYRVHWTVRVDGEEQPFLISASFGAGRIALLAGDRLAANERIGRRDNALALVRLFEELDGGGPILFGEYELGRWDPPSTWALAFAPTTILVTLHAIALLAWFAWSRAHARAFPRDPEPHDMFSPLLRARGVAGAFARDGRHGELAALARRATWSRMRAVLRLRETRGVAPEGAAAFAPIPVEEITAVTTRAALEHLAPRLESALVTRRVKTRDDLNALDVELRALEVAVAAHVHAHAHTSRPGEGATSSP